MAEKCEELLSDTLSVERMRVLLLAFPWVVKELISDSTLTACYGWSSNIHADLQYVPMKVGISWLEGFVEESLDQTIIIPGESDFFFSTHDGGLEVLFCHERDIHLNGTDTALIKRFLEAPPFSAVRFRTRKEIVQESSDSIREPLFMVEVSSHGLLCSGNVEVENKERFTSDES